MSTKPNTNTNKNALNKIAINNTNPNPHGVQSNGAHKPNEPNNKNNTNNNNTKPVNHNANTNKNNNAAHPGANKNNIQNGKNEQNSTKPDKHNNINEKNKKDDGKSVDEHKKEENKSVDEHKKEEKVVAPIENHENKEAGQKNSIKPDVSNNNAANKISDDMNKIVIDEKKSKNSNADLNQNEKRKKNSLDCSCISLNRYDEDTGNINPDGSTKKDDISDGPSKKYDEWFYDGLNNKQIESLNSEAHEATAKLKESF